MRFDSQRHHIQSLGDSIVHPQSDIVASTPTNEIKTSGPKGDRLRQFARKIFCICERPRTGTESSAHFPFCKQRFRRDFGQENHVARLKHDLRLT